MCWNEKKVVTLVEKSPYKTYFDLSLHGDTKECDEVHDQYRPEYRNIEELKEGTAKGNHSCLGG